MVDVDVKQTGLHRSSTKPVIRRRFLSSFYCIIRLLCIHKAIKNDSKFTSSNIIDYSYP